MTTTPGLSIPFNLSLASAGLDLHYPDQAVVTFDEALLLRVAKAQCALEASGENEVTLSLAHGQELRSDDSLWASVDASDFKPSNYWLKVERSHLQLVVWDENSDAELRGAEYLPNNPALAQALGELRGKALGQLQQALIEMSLRLAESSRSGSEHPRMR